MKTVGLLFAACLCYCCVLANSEIALPTFVENISFYETNLVCAAATDIGCGTRAKPVLKDFSEHPKVKEAWLNHAGTVVAVVWKEQADKTAIAKEVFGTYNLTYTEVTGDTSNEYLADFKNGKWYQGNKVDELSKIEAGRIADEVMAAIQKKTTIPRDVAPKMSAELEDYFKESLLEIQDVNVIYSGSYWKEWDENIARIGEKHLGEGKFPEFSVFNPSDCTSKSSASGKSSCTTKDKNSCCSKSKAF